MKKQIKYLNNILDFKDEDGNWVRSKTRRVGDYYLSEVTRAGILWSNMNKRCLDGGSNKRDHPSYANCRNEFKDFQEFAEWCQTQTGYTTKEINGRFWALDKDILKPGNKIYSSDLCCFIPLIINNTIKDLSYDNGLPLGVHFDKLTGKYRASIFRGKTIKLGRFTSPLDAHNAWKIAKIIALEETINEYSGIVDIRVISRLSDAINKLQLPGVVNLYHDNKEF